MRFIFFFLSLTSAMKGQKRLPRAPTPLEPIPVLVLVAEPALSGIRQVRPKQGCKQNRIAILVTAVIRLQNLSSAICHRHIAQV